MDISAINSATLNKPTQNDDIKKLRETAQSFEAYFISTLIKSMRESTIKSGFMSGGNGGETYQGMLDDKIAEAMAKRGNGIGIGNLLFKSFIKLYKDHGGHDGEEGKQKGL